MSRREMGGGGTTRWRVRAAFTLLGLGLLAYLTVRLGVREILAMLVSVGWSFPIALSLYVAHQALRAAALVLCVPRPGAISYRDALWIRFSGEAVPSWPSRRRRGSCGGAA
jgi:hypothetical protein